MNHICMSLRGIPTKSGRRSNLFPEHLGLLRGVYPVFITGLAMTICSGAISHERILEQEYGGEFSKHSPKAQNTACS